MSKPLKKNPHRQRDVEERKRPLGAPLWTPPGTLLTDPDAQRPIVRVLAYGPHEILEQEISDPRQAGDFLKHWPVTWVDVEGLGDANVISALGEVFGLHPLALEDVISNLHQRPKIEQYGDLHFIAARMVRLGEDLETEQLSVFLGKNFVVTFQEGLPGDCLEAVRDRIRKGDGRVREAGLDYLAYALLDALVDGYFPVLEEYGERLETLEHEIITRPSSDALTRIHEVKRGLLTLRRAVWPQREVLGALLREESSLFTPETRLYVRDCYDHLTQIIDLVETYRELGSDLTDVYLSSISNRTNEIMRVLAVISTVFLPLTFIAGVYGMNFNLEKSPWNMPELNWYWGYPFSLALMLVVAAGQLYLFWRKGWLGSSAFVGGAPNPQEVDSGHSSLDSAEPAYQKRLDQSQAFFHK